MTLASGTPLLHYRLAEKIGEGGMGEVWRATDTTLDREVAIKILPAAFASDPERLARFEREAKVLASLTHSNIAAVYGLHEAMGVRFLAMELVAGEDLAHRLARGPLPVDEAVDAAKQIAAALAAAHDSGVVHRDLKPANVKRAPDGTVKVLDFGLAKALETAGAPSAQSATITSAGSVAGVILGTAAYMSPEQARGQMVDRRTDMWSFGCLLYEMLSAKRAFDGPTITDVLAAVVTKDPDWDVLPPGTPVAARRLMRRCLEKDQRKRLRDAGDAILLLEDNPEDARIGISPTAAPVPLKRTPVALVVGMILAAIAVGAVGSWLLARRPAQTDEKDASHVVPRQLTFGRGMMRSARFAPDGKTIVYGAAWNGPPVKLYLSRTESPDSTALQTPDAELLSISKTGELAIALGLQYRGWMGSGTLARVPLLGGAPRPIAEHVSAADWTPDGSDLAIVYRENGEDRLEFPAGKVLYRTKGYIADVRFSPDGTKIAFTDHPVYADDRGDLAVVDLQGHKTTLASGFASIHGAAWGPGAREIWFEAVGDVGFSAIRTADLTGHVRVVYPSFSFIELLDVSPDGRVLIASQNQTRGVQAKLDGYDGPRPVTIPGESSLSRWISPDGRSILVTEQLTGDYDTYLVRAGEPGATHLGHGDGMGLTADGRWALSLSADATRLYISPVGAGKTRTLANPDGLSFVGDQRWLPDGKRIVAFGHVKSGPVRGYLLDATTGAAKPFTPEEVFPLGGGKLLLSPDGRTVLCTERGGTPVGWPIDGGEPKPVPGLQPDFVVLNWSEDEASLFCVRQDDPWDVFRLDLQDGRTSAWTKFDAIDPAGLRLWIDVITPNGKYWAVSTAKVFSDLILVDGLK